MILVNEEASKKFPSQAKSSYNLKLLDEGGKKILKIKKILDAGIATDSVMTTTVRLFLECSGSGSLTAEKIDLYKFGGIKFSKLNSLANETPLPVSVKLNGNGYVDIPVGSMDEEVDITLNISGNITKIYAAVNGYMHNLTKDIIEKLNNP